MIINDDPILAQTFAIIAEIADKPDENRFQLVPIDQIEFSVIPIKVTRADDPCIDDDALSSLRKRVELFKTRQLHLKQERERRNCVDG